MNMRRMLDLTIALLIGASLALAFIGAIALPHAPKAPVPHHIVRFA